MELNDNSITKIHAYNAIRSFLSEKTNQNLIDELGIRDGIERRISGLNCEYEFALISHFSEQFEFILGFDESFSKLTDTKTPDFFLKKKDGKKFFIEVKSKESDTFNDITETSLAKRKVIADELGAEWCLALKMQNRWGLFDYNTFTSKKRKVSYPLDLNDSIFISFFGFDYYIVQNIEAESIFSNEYEKIDRIRHKEYGTLINYKLKTGPIALIDDSSKNKSIFVEEIHNRFSNQEIQKINAKETRLIEKLDKPILVSTDQLMIASIMHTINQHGLRNDAKTFFDDFINHKDPSSQINAYKFFWQQMIDKCPHNEIVKPQKVLFDCNGNFQAEIFQV